MPVSAEKKKSLVRAHEQFLFWTCFLSVSPPQGTTIPVFVALSGRPREPALRGANLLNTTAPQLRQRSKSMAKCSSICFSSFSNEVVCKNLSSKMFPRQCLNTSRRKSKFAMKPGQGPLNKVPTQFSYVNATLLQVQCIKEQNFSLHITF